MNVNGQYHFPKIDVIIQQVEAGLVPNDNKGIKRVSCCTYIWHKYFSWLPCVELLSELCLKVYFKVIYDELSHFECKTSKEEVVNDPFRDLDDFFSTFSIQALDPKSPLLSVADKIKACADLYLKKKRDAVLEELVEVADLPIKQTEACFKKLKLSYRELDKLQRRLQECIAGPEEVPIHRLVQEILNENKELEHGIYSTFIGNRTANEKRRQDARTELYEVCNNQRALQNTEEWILEQLQRNYQILKDRLTSVQSTLESLKKQMKEIYTTYKSCSQTILTKDYIPRNLATEIEIHLKHCNELLSNLADWHKNATSYHKGLQESIQQLSAAKESLQSQFQALIAEQQSEPTVPSTALEILTATLPTAVNDIIFSYFNPFYIKTHLFNSFRILETRSVDIADMYDIRGDYESAQIILVGCRSDVLHNAEVFLSHLLSLPIHGMDYVFISSTAWSGCLEPGGFSSLISKINMLRKFTIDNVKDSIDWFKYKKALFDRYTEEWDTQHKYRVIDYSNEIEHVMFLRSRYKQMAALNPIVIASFKQEMKLRTLLDAENILKDKVFIDEAVKSGGFFQKTVHSNVLKGFDTALKKANDLVVSNVMETLMDIVCGDAPKKYLLRRVFFFVEQHPMLNYMTDCEKIAQKSGVTFAVFSAKMFG